jgi:hypothetical protein
MKRRIGTLVLAGTLVLSACAGGDEEPAASVEEGNDTEAVVEESEADESEESVDDEPAADEPEDDADTEPEEIAEEAIEEEDDLPDEIDELYQQIIFADTFEEVRSDLILDLEAGMDVESVDRIEYLTEDETFVLSVTSEWAGDDSQREAAWGIARHLAQFWSDDFWHNVAREPEWNPAFDLTVDSHGYSCAGEVMRDLADRRVDRSGWEQACS